MDVKNLTVLVVDDEPEYRMLIRELLMDEGMEVFTAENGEEALHKMSVVQMDFIISDIYMPVMDGIKFHQAVRQSPQYATIPFLFVSGYNDQYTMNAARDPRYDGFLQKGRPVSELTGWIRHLRSSDDTRGRLLPEDPSQALS